MNFRTEILSKPASFTISHQTRLMLLGSCFATNVGQQLEKYRFPSMINPFGVLYNPLSIARMLQVLIDNERCKPSDLVEHDGLWHSWLHHGSFSRASADACLAACNDASCSAAQWLRQTDVLIITFGTARVYREISSGRVVANCHKIPAKQFTNERLSVDEICDVWRTLIKQLLQINPMLKIVCTLSPIRHWKDGAHDNQLSKASLLLAIDVLQGEFQSISYFPAYELLMDDLRDYRFYESDMLHPNQTAIQYVWQQFVTMFLADNTKQLLKQINEVVQAVAHRPLHRETAQYRSFIEGSLRKIECLEMQNSGLLFTAEKAELQSRLLL